TSKRGLRLSRIDRTRRPPHQKNPCSARRSSGSNKRIKRRSPAKKAGSDIPMTVSDVYVWPPTVQAVRGFTASQSRSTCPQQSVGRSIFVLGPLRLPIQMFASIRLGFSTNETRSYGASSSALAHTPEHPSDVSNT